jgi:uncharacterized protein YndB with AHSA1/START domain
MSRISSFFDQERNVSVKAAMEVVAKPEAKEITLIRWFKAPRSLVWKAWTEPAYLTRWWGPLENPVCQVDLRVGGAYRIVMRSPDGIEFPLTGTFLDLRPPERLVMTMDTTEHPAEWQHLLNTYRGARKDEGIEPLELTALFAEQDDGTNLTVVAQFATVGDRDAHLTMGTTKGWGTSFDRLDALLQAM